MAFFSSADRKALKAYKYKSLDLSPIANNILNPYWWTPVSKLFPDWIAPNVITLSGFVFVVANVLTLLYFSPNLYGVVPSWAYFSFAIGMFLYQTFDAIDGKQARRTGTSGPLGELFDHGCDALNTGLGSLLGASAIGVKPGGWLVLIFLTTLGNFYLSTWEEYHTGVLFLSYFSGPLEGVLIVISTFLISGCFGTAVWTAPVSTYIDAKFLGETVAAWPVHRPFMYFSLVAVLANIVSSGYNVVVARRERKQSLLPPFLGLIPIGIFAALVTTWALIAPDLIKHSALPFTLIVTFLHGHHVGEIIVAHVAKRPFPFLHVPTLTVLSTGIISSGFFRWWESQLAYAFLNGAAYDPVKLYVPHALIDISEGWVMSIFGPEQKGAVVYALRNTRLMESFACWVLFIVTIWMYSSFVAAVVREMCEIFDIWCFRVGKRSAAKKAPRKKAVEPIKNKDVADDKLEKEADEQEPSAAPTLRKRTSARATTNTSSSSGEDKTAGERRRRKSSEVPVAGRTRSSARKMSPERKE